MSELGKMTMRVTAESDNFEQGLERSRQGVQQFESEMKQGKMGLADFKAGLDMAAQGLEMVGELYNETVQFSIDYAMGVEDTARALGVSAEEASTMIQVFDDLRISQGSMEIAMRTALRQGITPNMEGIMQMAEEYQALPDAASKAQYALERFGRNGLEMQRVLELDREELAAMADQVRDTALVIDEEYVKSADRARLAIDNFNDSVDSFKVAIGGDILPILAIYLNNIADIGDKTDDAADSTEFFDTKLGRLAETILKLSGGSLVWVLDEIALQEKSLAEFQLPKMTEELETQGETLYTLGEYYEVASTGVYELHLQEEALAEQQRELNQSYNDLQTFLAGPLGKETENYTADQEVLAGKIAEVKARIDELVSSPVELSIGEQEELAGLEEEYAGLQTMYYNEAASHEERTRRILLDLAMQRASIDGVSDEEMQVLNDLAYEWGLIDEETYNATKTIDEAFDALEDGKASVEEVSNAIAGIGVAASTTAAKIGAIKNKLAELNGMVVEATINLTMEDMLGIDWRTLGITGPISYATGGEFWATQPTLIMVGEGGEAEHVRVTPQSKAASLHPGGGDTINVVINDQMAGKMWLEELRRRKAARVEEVMNG